MWRVKTVVGRLIAPILLIFVVVYVMWCCANSARCEGGVQQFCLLLLLPHMYIYVYIYIEYGYFVRPSPNTED